MKMIKIRENNRIRTIACAGLFSIIMHNSSKRVRSVWVKEYRRRYGHLPLIYVGIIQIKLIDY